jgi:hypothetical protein
MRLLRFRVRTLMIAVSVVALVVWGAMMGTRPYDYYGRARRYVLEERGWRESAANGRFRVEFCSQCVDYFEELSRKYRRAMWRPWLPVAPDPHAPGFDQWLEQERRAKEGTPDPGVMKTWIGAAARSPQFCCARPPPAPPLTEGGQGGSRAIPERRRKGTFHNPPVPPLRKGGSVSCRGAQQIEPPRWAQSANVAAAFQHPTPMLPHSGFLCLKVSDRGQHSTGQMLWHRSKSRGAPTYCPGRMRAG